MRKLLVLLLFATSLSALPVVTGVTPSSAPAAGGTTVTITGTGFETCPICSPPLPPNVRFGDVDALSVIIGTDKTLVVTVPPHLPATVDITVEQWNGDATLRDAFTYTGPIGQEFDRVLLPLFVPPIDGAFGSRFVTELRLSNPGDFRSAFLFGLQPRCVVSACVTPDGSEFPYEIASGESIQPNQFEYTGNPGRFVYIAKSGPEVQANLRVFDSSRSAFNFGTEMPVVHEREFTGKPIKLLGVPLDARFRNTLRIYGTQAMSVIVSYGTEAHVVQLTPGRDLFDPAYRDYSAFPVGTGTIDVTVEPFLTPPDAEAQPAERIWAFISVTNNDTQLITTITPQR